MEESKLKDKLKREKADKALQFVKEHIRYFAAGALFCIMVIVLVFFVNPDDKKETSIDSTTAVEEEYQVNTYEEVNALITQYYNAYAAGDIATLTAIATPVSANEQSYITMFSQYVESYQNIQCYTKSGLDANSYLVSVSMEIKFAGVDTLAPGLDFFYVRTNEAGTLYIDNLYSQYNLANQENALDTSIQNLIYEFESQEDVIELQSEIQTKYDAAVNADTNLSTMIYTTVPNAITDWVTQVAAQNVPTETPTETAEVPPTEVPAEDTQTSEPAEPETPAPTTQSYYTKDTVNVRASASTDAEKIGSIEKGTEIQIISSENGWSFMNYGGYDGYIKSEYLTTDQSEITAESEEQASTDVVALAQGTEVTLKDTVNIRSGMNENSERIGTAYSGEKVTVVMSYAEGWSKVTWNGKTGYIKSSLLQ